MSAYFRDLIDKTDILSNYEICIKMVRLSFTFHILKLVQEKFNIYLEAWMRNIFQPTCLSVKHMLP